MSSCLNTMDTTGEGDTFHREFVTVLAEEKDLFEALHFGNTTAVLSITRLGTVPVMPFREEVDKLLLDMERV